MTTKSIIVPAVGFTAAAFLIIIFINGNTRTDSPPQVTSMSSSTPGQEGLSKPQPDTDLPVDQKFTGVADSTLQGALAERDAVRRKQLLRQWADAMETGRIEDFLAHIGSTTSPEMRTEVRQALLSSWTARDLPGMTSWFGGRYAADEMHQESRDLLIETVNGWEPAEAFTWMESSLPKSVRLEIYGPFFRNWAAEDPAAAATKLRHLAEASTGDPAAWTLLIGQVAKQWAGTDLKSALTWTKALPEGAAKSEALVQMGYQWAEKDPRAAAAYATGQNNGPLLNAVASTWAIKDPRGAAGWVMGQTTGDAQNNMIAGVAAVWTQKDPAAAAAWANGLPSGSAGDQAKISVASMWATADASNAAKWVDQFPEGPLRERALEPVITSWALNNPNEASQWLRHLPDNRSRNVAVGAFCSVLEGTDPEASYSWAQTITDESIRTQKMKSAALARDQKTAVAR